ncbi:MAG: hypothetical protein K6C94_04790 [Candidatus Gastranaerophilales bacterium]|nr:hypothetical protein [Candidatus Gastranaerophilales bacterium]
MNKFELFMKRVSDMPLYIKELVCKKLSDEIKSYNCQENFSSYIPILTFKGENELSNKHLGFDFNIYNFLDFSKKGYNITEISVNTFLTVEETSKLFEICLDEELIEKPDNTICSVAEYLSGKIRLGEYLLKISKITEEQLNNVLKNNSNEKKIGEKLAESNYITLEDIKAILKLKDEAQKRFVLDNETVPTTKMACVSDENLLKDEISALKSENAKLKNRLNKLREFVK